MRIVAPRSKQQGAERQANTQHIERKDCSKSRVGNRGQSAVFEVFSRNVDSPQNEYADTKTDHIQKPCDPIDTRSKFGVWWMLYLALQRRRRPRPPSEWQKKSERK